MRSRDEALSRLSMRNPWHLLATGFGSGLSPVVPGTMGSLAAIPFWYLMTFLHTGQQALRRCEIL